MNGVYFVLDNLGAAIKIGHSINIDSRFVSLQTGNPRSLSLYAVWEGKTPHHERLLHDMFADHRMIGEWFAAEPVMQFLKLMHHQSLDFWTFSEPMFEAFARMDQPEPGPPMYTQEEYRHAIKALFWFSVALFLLMVNIALMAYNDTRIFPPY